MKKNKVLQNIIFSVLLAVIVEGIISIVPNYYKNNVQGYKQIVLTLDDFTLYNWAEDENGGYTSLPDPMFVIEDLQADIKDMDIAIDTQDSIIGTTIFFTEEEGQAFNGENIIAGGSFKNSRMTAEVNRFVNDLRIDPGEAEGIHINNISVTLNPDRVRFSLSRFLAVIILYFSTLFLFGLQKRPDYTEFENNSEES